MRKEIKDKEDRDLTKPIDKTISKDSSCFGKAWDVTAKECKICAERDVCGILFKDTVDIKAKEVEVASGSMFLDRSDFKFTEEELINLKASIVSGVTTVKELLLKVATLAESSDKVAITEHTKRLIVGDPNLYTKDGLVWKR